AQYTVTARHAGALDAPGVRALRAAESDSWLRLEMTEADSRRFQETVRGRSFSVFHREAENWQLQLFNAALHRLAPDRAQALLQEEPESVNPLRTRHDAGLGSHRDAEHWPLRALIYARLRIEEKQENVRLVQSALTAVREWEDQLVVAIHLSVLSWTEDQTRSLRMLLKE
ncbi:unnamed protein product, partial [Effrenium voratum]